MGTTGDGSSRHDPFDGLAGHGCDQVEVVVVVEYDQSGCFGCGRNEQVGDLGATMLAAIGKHVLHLDCPIQYGLIHRHQRPRSPELAHGAVCGRAGQGVAGLEIRWSTPGDQSALEKWRQARCHRWMREAGEC